MATRADLVGLRADESALPFAPDVALSVGAGPQQCLSAALLDVQIQGLHVCSKHVVPEGQTHALAIRGRLCKRHSRHN